MASEVCSKCGTAIETGYTVCWNCGTNVDGTPPDGSFRAERNQNHRDSRLGISPDAPSFRARYLRELRGSSCYSTFRAFIGVCSVVGYCLSILIAVGAFLVGGSLIVVGGVACAVALAFIVKASSDASLMIADMADATVDASARNAKAV